MNQRMDLIASRGAPYNCSFGVSKEMLDQLFKNAPSIDNLDGDSGAAVITEQNEVVGTIIGGTEPKKKKVLVFWTNRAEEGLLVPIVKRLEKDPDIDCVPVYPEILHGTDPEKLGKIYLMAYNRIRYHAPDLVIAPFDRVEMLMVAIAADQANVPVCQLHAGDLSGGGTTDDAHRHAITMIADLVFCNGQTSWNRALFLKRAGWMTSEPEPISETAKKHHVYDVGSFAVDDIEPNYSLVPSYQVAPPANAHPMLEWAKTNTLPFDLVLYNPETATDKDEDNFLKIFELLRASSNQVIWIGPNGDQGSERIISLVRNIDTFYGRGGPELAKRIQYHPSVRRAQFLGLMQKADRIIGNSSSFCLEALLLRDDWETAVHLIGTRNTSDRFLRDSRPGAADRIHEHIRRYLGLE